MAVDGGHGEIWGGSLYVHVVDSPIRLLVASSEAGRASSNGTTGCDGIPDQKRRGQLLHVSFGLVTEMEILQSPAERIDGTRGVDSNLAQGFFQLVTLQLVDSRRDLSWVRSALVLLTQSATSPVLTVTVDDFGDGDHNMTQKQRKNDLPTALISFGNLEKR